MIPLEDHLNNLKECIGRCFYNNAIETSQSFDLRYCMNICGVVGYFLYHFDSMLVND